MGAIAAAAVVVLAGASAPKASADDTMTWTTHGCQSYQVPDGETRVEVDAIGDAGQAGGNNIEGGSGSGYSFVVNGGTGGKGAEVDTILSVTPGSFLSEKVAGLPGGYGGFAFFYYGEPTDTNPGVGGAGGGGSVVYGGLNCSGSELVVAARGGGGGGAGTNAGQLTGGDFASGGAGGDAGAGGANAQPGGENQEDDGAPGQSAFYQGSTAEYGLGGTYGYGTKWRLAPKGPALIPTYFTCSPGWPGEDGYNGEGGTGGAADEQDVGHDDGCAQIVNLNDNSGGGGGGGGGYVGGGGGGGADDYAAAGAGGGSGLSYVKGQVNNGVPTSKPASVTITAIPTAPAVTGYSYPDTTNGTCTVDQFCRIDVSMTGYPTPCLTPQSLPQGMSLLGNGCGTTASIVGTPTGGDVSGDSQLFNIPLDIGNGVSPDATPTLPLTITFGPLNSLSLSPDPSQPLQLTAAVNTGQLTVYGHYASGFQRDLSSVADWESTKPNVATVSSTGFVNPLKGGITLVSAAWDGKVVADEVDVSRGPAIDINVLPLDPYVGLGQTQQFSATAYYQDGETQDVTNQVVWSSDTSAATINSAGLATATGTTELATADIRATLLNPDSTPQASSSPDTLTVFLDDPTSISVTPANPTLGPNSETQFTATGTYPGGAQANITNVVNWGSANDNIATFDDGTPGLLFVQPDNGPTTVNVTASAPEGDASGSTQVTTFAGDPTSITVSPPDGTPTQQNSGYPEVGLGSTLQLSATAHYADGSTQDVTSQVQWSSTDPGSATVDSSGLVTGTGTTFEDSSNISAVFTGPDGAQIPSNNLTLAVSFDSPTSITVTPADPTMAPGTSQVFTATGTYPGGAQADITHVPGLTWQSSDPSRGDFSSGTFIASTQNSGPTTVTATSPDGKTSGSTLVTVTGGTPQFIQITPGNQTIGLGTTEQLTATLTFDTGPTADVTGDVTWSSDTPSEASVDSNGLVTGNAPGQGATPWATITATFTPPNDPSNPISATTTVIVSAANPLSIAVTGDSSMLAGQSQNPTVTGTYPGGVTYVIPSGQVTWTEDPSDFGLLSVNAGEIDVQPHETGGTADLGVSFDGVNTDFDVTVTPSVTVSGTSSDTGTFLSPGYQSPTFTASGGTGNYTWKIVQTSPDPNQPNSDPGLIQGPLAGPTTYLHGTPFDPANAPYTFAVTATDALNTSDSYTFTFTFDENLATQTFTWNPPAMGTSGTVIGTPTIPGATNNDVVVSVDASSTPGSCTSSGFDGHTITFSTPGSCVLDAHENGNASYQSADRQATINVVKQVGTLSWAQGSLTPPSDVTVGSGSPWLLQTFTTGDPTQPVTMTVDPATTNSACSLTSLFPSSVDSYDISFDHIGTCVIDANQSGSLVQLPPLNIWTYYGDTAQLQETFTVTATQSIDFSSPAPTDAVVGGSYSPTFDVGSNGPANSGQTSLTPADGVTACTVTDNSTVQFVHAGDCTLQAVEEGDSDYQASPTATQDFTIAQASQTITATPLAASSAAGTFAPLNATGGDSGNNVTFSVDPATTNSACVVVGASVFFSAQGTCVVDANQAGTDDYEAAPQVTLQTTVDAYGFNITSDAFSTTATNSADMPVTVEADQDGSPQTLSSPVTVQLVSTNSTGVFSDTQGGSAVTSVVIPAGESSVTVYYGDPTAGSVGVGAYDLSGAYALASQVETITPDAPASAQFKTQPSGTVVGHTLAPAPRVLVEDQFGNPVPGAQVTLSDSTGTLSGDLQETTDSTGTATFSGLSVGERGTDSLQAMVAGQSATSSRFTVAGIPQSITTHASSTLQPWNSPVTLTPKAYVGSGAIAYHLDHGTNKTGDNSASSCSLSGTSLSATAPGTCFVYTTIAADSTYAVATSPDVSVTFTAATITATVSGSETYGSKSANLAFTDDAPNGVSLLGAPKCTTAGGKALTALTVGNYTLDGSSCSGLTTSDATRYNVSYAGAPSGFVVSPIPVPVQSAATAGNGQVTVKWSAGSGAAATGYDVFDSTTSKHESISGTPACKATASARSCVVTGLVNGTSYYFVVVALNGTAMSAVSGERSATPTPPASASAPVKPASATTVTVGFGAASVSVTVPAGAVPTSGTLKVTALKLSEAGDTLAPGTVAVKIHVTATNGQAITQFAVPLQIAFPKAPTSVVPAYSGNGTTWTKVPKLAHPPTLPAASVDGWYRSNGTLEIRSRRANDSALLTPTSTVSTR